MPENVQITQQLTALLEVTMRVDERVESMQRGMDNISCKVEELQTGQHRLDGRVAILEATDYGNRIEKIRKSLHAIRGELHELKLKFQDISSVAKRTETSWSSTVQWVVTIVGVVVGAYVIHHAGWDASINGKP